MLNSKFFFPFRDTEVNFKLSIFNLIFFIQVQKLIYIYDAYVKQRTFTDRNAGNYVGTCYH